ncbi:MAG: ABC transporter ATP-binding protein [Alphaproteobacteria bacterium]|nr:MAG: ABC transporter ATP-binding protein [Alphaproteobacteria bacterium]TAF15639.1 MAG: ABC transporter ATP-binding protein [Alphaproteobacteria bacterium]TAF37423.1 MAG: ABC transporter ATP-binding protein [Alphaproteobacteria bacterium]TAF76198.1 MAG: ABC transporter ATP-binding protein [Alphaproteobacteria bacterium]
MNPAQSAYAVEIEGLQKSYRGRGAEAKMAVKGIDLRIPRGSFFGLLGPNGAGKSTTINILAGLVKKTAGRVVIGGYDSDTHEREARQMIGVVPQELVLDTFFTVRQALELHAGYYGIPAKKRQTQHIIDVMGLSDKADARPRSLSGGMRRRLLIGKALVHQPDILVLDEPTAGVDIELRTQLWDYVRELNRQGTTIVLTTHYLEEAEALCDEIAIMNHGAVVACDTKRRLMEGFDSKCVLVRLTQPIQELPEMLHSQGWELQADGRLLRHYAPRDSIMDAMLADLHAHGYEVADLSTRETELEAIFRHLTSMH